MKTRLQYWDQGGFQEGFTYDALNRLETSQVQGQAVQNFKYDAAGNMQSKTGAGTGDYVYPTQGANAIRPHAVKNIPGIGDFLSPAAQMGMSAYSGVQAVDAVDPAAQAIQKEYERNDFRA